MNLIVFQYFILNIIFCSAQHENDFQCPVSIFKPDEHCSQMCDPFYPKTLPGNFGKVSDCIFFKVFAVPRQNKYLLITMHNKCAVTSEADLSEFVVQAVDTELGFPVGRWDVNGTRNVLEDVCTYNPDKLIDGVKSSDYVYFDPTKPNIVLEKDCQHTLDLQNNRFTNKDAMPTYILFDPKHMYSEDFKGFNALWYYNGPEPSTTGTTHLEIVFRIEWQASRELNDMHMGKQYINVFHSYKYEYTPKIQPSPPNSSTDCFLELPEVIDKEQTFHAHEQYKFYIANKKYLQDIASGNTIPPTTTTSTTTTTTSTTTTRVPPQPITRRPTKPTIPPVILPSPQPPKSTSAPPKPPDLNKQKIERDDIYAKCKVSKRCLPSTANPEDGKSGTGEDGCIKRRDCPIMISYGDSNRKIPSTHIYIELEDDFVIECVKEDSSEIKMYTSWNTKDLTTDKTNKRMNKNDEKYNFILLYESGHIDNELFCKFAVKKLLIYYDPQRNLTPTYFNLEKTLYYILTASGINQEGISGVLGNLNYHTESTRFISRYPVAIGSRFSPNSEQQIQIRLHGAFMFMAFVFFIPNASFLARYYKETFIEISIWGLRQWLLWHIVLHLVGLVLIITGHFFLTFANAGWSSPNTVQTTSFHLWSSLSTSSFYLFNIIIGCLDCERPIGTGCDFCHWLHSIIGHVTYAISLATMTKADEVFYSNLPCMTWKIVVSWTVIYIFFHIIMSYHYCWIDWALGVPARAYTLGPIQVMVQPQSLTVAPGKAVRIWILILFVLISGGFGLSLALIAGFSYEREDTSSMMIPCYSVENFIELTDNK